MDWKIGDKALIPAKKDSLGYKIASDRKLHISSNGFTEFVHCEIVDMQYSEICDVKTKYGVNTVWIEMLVIASNVVVQQTMQSEILCCTECKDGFPMSVPNCKDGKTLICWSCRRSYGWKYNSILI